MSGFAKPRAPRLHDGHRAELDHLARRLDLLARHLDVDLDELERVAGPDVRAELPASWESMQAAGFDPISGEVTG